MGNEPQLYRIDTESRIAEKVQEVNFDQLGLKERQDIQEWVAFNHGLLGENLLIVSKEFDRFDRTNERLDLLAVDPDGKLVIIEMKRDDTGADVHWQAIKYASYLRRATPENIIEIFSKHAKIPTEDARLKLEQHTGSEELNSLNNDQRIVLASHRFAPEVTSASLWLNEKSHGGNLITCVTLTPYRDSTTGTLYIQATTIIPVPGTDPYEVGIRTNAQDVVSRSRSSLGERLSATFQRNKNDEVTDFLRDVGQRVLRELPVELRPNKTSRWAGDTSHFRYYHFWYSRGSWRNWSVDYEVNLWPMDSESSWRAEVDFRHNLEGLQEKLSSLSLNESQNLKSDGTGITVDIGTGTLNDEFAEPIAAMTRKFIEQITPLVEDLGNESDDGEQYVEVETAASPAS